MTGDISTYVDDDTGNEIAWATAANPAHVADILSAPTDTNNGRSNWVWVRLSNGDLLLAVFPQGETYLKYADVAGV